MAESVYKVIELVGASNESWEKAAAAAIERASQTLRDLRVARIVEQDVHIESGKPLTYRVKVEGGMNAGLSCLRVLLLIHARWSLAQSWVAG